ncbi:MAG: LysM peptidoglycan-binding domain-containing protein [Muribaculaceae bacterium]|nr:LysM peptidoglycan-binding domain-containing protein [Muribaculaceae bacterium]
MKRKSFIIMGAALMMTALSVRGADPDLPKVEILGKEYYYHEIKKGESIYGIAKQHGWDLDELVRLNPATASDMAKGSRLYYPTGRVTVVTDFNPDMKASDNKEDYEPIRHLVKRGETVYSISRQYNIPVETIYASCPDSKYGIKAGETLVIQQPASGKDGGYLYYEIKSGDTLFGLAKKYHTSVEDILTLNPGVSERNFKSGETIRIAVNSEQRKVHTELVEESRLASLDSYKVGRKDDWNSISQKTGVAVETLKEANDNVEKPKKNDVINIPVMETVTVEKEYIESDPREKTTEGIRELYDSIHNTNGNEMLQQVKVALLLEEPTGKRDIDFTRGFLTALDGMSKTPFKIDFKVIDGRSASEKVLQSLDEYHPNLLISTADKSFPVYLAEYGNKYNVEVVNVFDIKNELCEENPSIIQLLPSSAYFNQQMGEQLFEDYGNRKIVMVGRVDSGDGIAEAFLAKLGDNKPQQTSVASLTNYSVAGDNEYLFYCYSTRKDEIADILQAIENIREREPFAEIAVVGRPNWVTLTETYGDRFGDAGVVIPSRVWFDADSDKGKRFVRNFTSLFGSAPVKSFPNFAACGYDVANYFIPSTAKNGGDFNKGFNEFDAEIVQSDIRLERINNWGGFTNRVGYFVKFRPGGFVDKIMLK